MLLAPAQSDRSTEITETNSFIFSLQRPCPSFSISTSLYMSFASWTRAAQFKPSLCLRSCLRRSASGSPTKSETSGVHDFSLLPNPAMLQSALSYVISRKFRTSRFPSQILNSFGMQQNSLSEQHLPWTTCWTFLHRQCGTRQTTDGVGIARTSAVHSIFWKSLYSFAARHSCQRSPTWMQLDLFFSSHATSRLAPWAMPTLSGTASFQILVWLSLTNS